MSTNLVKLLSYALAAMVGGYLVSWVYEMATQPPASTAAPVVAKPTGTETESVPDT